MTICVNCKHLIAKEERIVWYNLFCGASEREPATDPVTGETGYISRNSLGEQHVTKDRFEYCRSVNTNGDCKLFEARRNA